MGGEPGGHSGYKPTSWWQRVVAQGSMWSPVPKGGWVVWRLTRHLGSGELWGDQRPAAVRRMRALMGARDRAGTHRSPYRHGEACPFGY